ncbi:MAG: lipopolysaccharide heptosyltransferase II [Candidatus Omnitrophica bacterium]|nr:lipopolysaccharide heptosyltransferase II [Candidatus Omnitrophota bacterium]
MRKILVVNVNWVGDVIFSSPIFKALKAAYPQSQISCLAVPRVREILESIPAIDEIILYDEDGAHRGPLAKLRLIHALFQKHFDAAFLLHRSLTRALFTFFAGIPQRIGYDAKGRGMFLTRAIKTPDEQTTHRLDYYLNVVESFGVTVADRASSLTASIASETEIRDLLKRHDVGDKDFLVVVHPGGNWDLKRWPVHHFARLIDELMKDGKVKVVISGSDQDVVLTEAIISGLRRKPVVLAGKVDLKQLLALMKRADCVVSADSGPLHIASSVGTSVVGIFGPTRPEITGPRGSGRAVILQRDVGCNRRPCYNLECPDNICMQAVSVKEVLDAVRQFQDQ